MCCKRVCTQTLNSKSVFSKVPLVCTDRPLPSDCTYWPSFLPSLHTPPHTLHMHTYTHAQDLSSLLVMWRWSVYLSVPLAECSCTSSKTPWHGGSPIYWQQDPKDESHKGLLKKVCLCVWISWDDTVKQENLLWLIGASLSKPQTGITSLCPCVCMFAWILLGATTYCKSLPVLILRICIMH